MTDEEFAASFEACTLPDFTHRDHIRIAWIYLQRFPYARAVDAMEKGVRRFAAHHGAHDKYHHTLTLAWMRLVAAAAADPSDDFEAFLARHPHLLERDAPRRYYSGELLNSAPARAGWVEPDLNVLPVLRQE